MDDLPGESRDDGVLNEREYAALAQWADAEPSADFVDDVMAAWICELGERDERSQDPDDSQAIPLTDPETGRGRARPRRSRPKVIAVAVAVAASVAVLWLARARPATGSIVVPKACDQLARGSSSSEIPIPTVEPRAAAPADRLTADALAVLVHHCTPCHDGAERQRAEADALQVFDVSEPDFWAPMSDAQLRETETRVQQLGVATEPERRSMASFVDRQLRRRARSG